ncbi:MAG: helix-turn-helix domain-containing protein [Spirochaetaceae bacterium]|nr:helix-turn-helix domain-containing protein [Spirochaetaceae bacterium]
MIEGDVFKTIVPLQNIGAVGFTENPIGDPGITKNETQDKILALLRNDPSLTITALAIEVGISERNIKQHIKSLKEADLLDQDGSNRKGQWVVKI